MLSSAVEYFKKAKAAHAELYALIVHMRTEMQGSISLEDYADLYYACDGVAKLIEDVEKENRLFYEYLARVGCAIYTKTSSDGSPIRTDYATITPDIKMMARMPKRKDDPQKYREFMRALGVPDNLIGDDEGRAPVSVNWRGMVDHITALVSTGKPLPVGIDPNAMYPIASFRVTAKRKEIDSE